MAESHNSGHTVVIRPATGWQMIDWKELVEYRDLFWFLIWRNVKVQYAQSVLGIGWAVVQPVFSTVVFAVVFGRLAGLSSDGAPYPLFALAGLVPWTYFANALQDGTQSLVGNTGLLGKVYFPRAMLPLSAVAAKLIDFVIAFLLLAGLLAWYGVVPGTGVLFLPLLVLLMVVTAAGLGMWLTALAVQYRDVRYAMNFVMQAMMYCTPVVYPTSLIPETYVLAGYHFHPRLWYALNPMVGVIEGFRAALLGTVSMPWDLIGISAVSTAVIAVTGGLYFRRKERLFADVV